MKCSAATPNRAPPAAVTPHNSSSFVGQRVQTRVSQSAHVHGRRVRLSVHCNELNKWADRSGPEENSGLPDNQFQQYTTLVVLKCLTARAVQKVIMEMQQSNTQVARWLNTYCGEHPPLKGDEFLLELMGLQERHYPGDQYGHEFVVRPIELANRIIAIRTDLSKQIAGEIHTLANERNVGVMREHLEKHSYTSGSWDTEDKRLKAKQDSNIDTNQLSR